MENTKIFLPGTTIEVTLDKKGISNGVLSNIFMTGGLVLSQMSQLTGLEPYIIQNWIKRGFLSPPVRKQYSRRQFCRVVIINMLKESLQLEKIVSLLTHINGQLDDESDDLIDDSKLYDYYVDLLFRIESEAVETKDYGKIVTEEVKDYTEPKEGSRERLEKVLVIMLYAHYAARMMKKAEELLTAL